VCVCTAQHTSDCPNLFAHKKKKKKKNNNNNNNNNKSPPHPPFPHKTRTHIQQKQVLIYLNTVAVGGKTFFPRLNISVTPTKGMALVFFPASLDGRLDEWVRIGWWLAWFGLVGWTSGCMLGLRVLFGLVGWTNGCVCVD
jgi:hypothetical protein